MKAKEKNTSSPLSEQPIKTDTMSSMGEIMRNAFSLMATAKAMTDLYEANFKEVSKYVHATARGHEAIQIAMGMLLTPDDWLSAYYRDDALLLAIGMKP
ncbi:MAG: hypothetical protein WAT91_06430, partial [Saprospiraceae bacterium]